MAFCSALCSSSRRRLRRYGSLSRSNSWLKYLKKQNFIINLGKTTYVSYILHFGFKTCSETKKSNHYLISRSNLSIFSFLEVVSNAKDRSLFLWKATHKHIRNFFTTVENFFPLKTEFW
jgi:hypothetical protein